MTKDRNSRNGQRQRKTGSQSPPPPPPPDSGLSGDNLASESGQRNFVRKAYAVLALEMAITGSVMIFYYNNQDAIVSFQDHLLLWTLLDLMLLLLLTVCHRLLPINYLLMIGFCLCNGVVLTAVSVSYGRSAVIIAVWMTASIFGCLTILSFLAGEGVRVERNLLGTLLIIVVFLLVLNFIVNSDLLDIAASCAAACLFSCYIQYDTEKMIASSYYIPVSSQDYMYPAIALYLDIICVFACIMHLAGYSNLFVEDGTSRRRRRSLTNIIGPVR